EANRWTITQIKENIGAIDAGKAAGITQGMKLIVFRDNKFVGYFCVVTVRPNQAAGTFSQLQLPPKVGDALVSGKTLER
ncbi:MAG: hypothetical protein ACLFVU_14690, partial [Phycisphaerae bacterium]